MVKNQLEFKFGEEIDFDNLTVGDYSRARQLLDQTPSVGCVEHMRQWLIEAGFKGVVVEQGVSVLLTDKPRVVMYFPEVQKMYARRTGQLRRFLEGYEEMNARRDKAKRLLSDAGQIRRGDRVNQVEFLIQVGYDSGKVEGMSLTQIGRAYGKEVQKLKKLVDEK